MTVIAFAHAPDSWPLPFKEGLQETEYGPLFLTAENIQKTVDIFTKRGRSIPGDYEHDSSREKRDNPAPSQYAAPFHSRLEARKTLDGLQLFTANTKWTKQGAQMVGTGEVLYCSPELRDTTKLRWDADRKAMIVDGGLDIKTIALTNDPAIYNLEPIRADLRFSIADVKASKLRFAMPFPPKKDSDSEKDPTEQKPDDGPKPSAFAAPEKGDDKGKPEDDDQKPEDSAPDPDGAPAPTGDPEQDETESQESDRLEMIADIIENIVSADRLDIPEDVKRQVAIIGGMVAEGLVDQSKEVQTLAAPAAPISQPAIVQPGQMPPQAATPPQGGTMSVPASNPLTSGVAEPATDGAPVDATKKKAAPDAEPNAKIMSILAQHFGDKLSPEALETQLMRFSILKKNSVKIRDAAAESESVASEALYREAVSKGQLSPYDAENKNLFLRMSISAKKEFVKSSPSYFEASVQESELDGTDISTPLPSHRGGKTPKTFSISAKPVERNFHVKPEKR
jgi:hypothetical protein